MDAVKNLACKDCVVARPARCFMGSLVKVYCIPLEMKATAAGEAVEVGTE